MLLLSVLALIGCTHRPVASAPSLAAPDVQIPGSSLEFYEISGANPVDLVESLVTVSPATGNIHHAAQTRWEVVWRYPAGPEDRPEQCDLSTVDVNVSIVTDFPRWSPSAEAAESGVGIGEHATYVGEIGDPVAVEDPVIGVGDGFEEGVLADADTGPA